MARGRVDSLEEAQALQAEMIALDRVEVKVPRGAPYVVEWRDDGTIVVERPNEEPRVFDARECADDLRSENLHDFSAEDASLLHDAVVDAYHRSILLQKRLHEAIARLRDQRDERELARELVAKDDARLAALDEQRRRESEAIARRRAERRRKDRRETARIAVVIVAAVVALLGIAQIVRGC